MHKYRRTASMFLGGATLALTSIVGLGGPARAATGGEILVPLALPGAVTLPETFKAGDCRQVGENDAGSLIPSRITVEPSATIQDHYTVRWYGTLYTQKTHSLDYWHAKFTFRAYSGPIFSIFFDGPPMVEDKVVQTEQSADVVVPADQASQIHFVDWIGDC
jgi:hypothetical protein